MFEARRIKGVILVWDAEAANHVVICVRRGEISVASALFQCGRSVHSTFAHSIFEGSPSKEGFHGTHENPSRSATVKNAKILSAHKSQTTCLWCGWWKSDCWNVFLTNLLIELTVHACNMFTYLKLIQVTNALMPCWIDNSLFTVILSQSVCKRQGFFMQTNQQVNSSLDYPVWLTCLDHATSQASKTSSDLNDLPVQAHSVLGASDSPPSRQHEISLPLCK